MNEAWKAIPEFEGIYEASDLGRIRRINFVFKGRKPPYYLKPLNHPHGYQCVALHKDDKQKTYLIHRLVMAAFRGPSSLHVNHKDGDKKNNIISNLEYCTQKQNAEHASKHDLVAHGQRVSGAKLNEDKVREVRALFAQGVNYKEIGARFQMHPMNVYHIVNRITWKRVT